MVCNPFATMARCLTLRNKSRNWRLYLRLDPLRNSAMPDSDFWTFSLQTYAKPNVAGVCLELQDRFGVDVNLLLYMLWAASRGRLLHVHEIAAIAGYVQAWQKQVVTPLRVARRQLKSSPPDGWSRVETDQLRQRIKAEELEAERL